MADVSEIEVLGDVRTINDTIARAAASTADGKAVTAQEAAEAAASAASSAASAASTADGKAVTAQQAAEAAATAASTADGKAVTADEKAEAAQDTADAAIPSDGKDTAFTDISSSLTPVTEDLLLGTYAMRKNGIVTLSFRVDAGTDLTAPQMLAAVQGLPANFRPAENLNFYSAQMGPVDGVFGLRETYIKTDGSVGYYGEALENTTFYIVVSYAGA